ncbi:MAG: stress response translation initiation inhibitor YciH [Desulfobacteraceae bacterium]|nr:stress response translation initiation inhibitor YciH [Desulfobacteraceae bacterium]
MDNNRLVYSTEVGRICDRCRKPVSECRCGPASKKKRQATVISDGVVRIGREVKGRGGKTVSVIRGLPLTGPELKLFAKVLKQACGTGGSVKEGTIIIQGDHREKLKQTIKKEGYTVKLAGG